MVIEFPVKKGSVVLTENDLNEIKRYIKINYSIDETIFYPRCNRRTKNIPSEYLKKTKMIYILFFKDEIVYVGQTVNIRERLLEHKRKYHWKWNYYSVLLTGNKNVALFVERLLILEYNPVYNKE